MPKISAGLLMYKRTPFFQVFLSHPGGPYFRNRDEGFWGIPKGMVEEEEGLLAAAKREFEEETGIIPQGPFHPLPTVRYKSSRKWLHAWAFEGDWKEEAGIQTQQIELEWPPKSGTFQSFPEIDRARWFEIDEARTFVHEAQLPLLEALEEFLK